MQWLNKTLVTYLLRSFQKDIHGTQKVLEDKERILMLSSMYQNPSFRNYINQRNADIVLKMAGDGKLPTNTDYLIFYGRRLELLNLLELTRIAYDRRQKEIVEK